jgi:hypothetical protein
LSLLQAGRGVACIRARREDEANTWPRIAVSIRPKACPFCSCPRVWPGVLRSLRNGSVLFSTGSVGMEETEEMASYLWLRLLQIGLSRRMYIHFRRDFPRCWVLLGRRRHPRILVREWSGDHVFAECRLRPLDLPLYLEGRHGLLVWAPAIDSRGCVCE